MILHADRIETTHNSPTTTTTTTAPTFEILFLHGLLGHGRNLKTFAKQVCDVKQANGLLMDLRGHGKSRLATNTLSSSSAVAAAATTGKTTFGECVADIQQSLDQKYHLHPNMVVGHSWGGRMAVQYAHSQRRKGGGSSPTIEQVWLLDVVPGQANESVENVVNIVQKLQQKEQAASTIPTKKDLIRKLTQEEGLDMPTSTWLASSYSGNGDFGFDLSVVQDILPEFGTQDIEGMMVELLHDGVKIDLVRGGKNKAWSIPMLNRLEKLKREFPGGFGLHVLPNAGHWVHVDDLKGLVSLFAAKR